MYTVRPKLIWCVAMVKLTLKQDLEMIKGIRELITGRTDLERVVTAVDKLISDSMVAGNYDRIQASVPEVARGLNDEDYSLLLRVLRYKIQRDKAPAAAPFYEEALKCAIASRLDYFVPEDSANG